MSQLSVLHFNREMYQAERYHSEFSSPMAIAGVDNNIHLFVNDFVRFHYNDELNDVMGKVKKFFKKVHMVSNHITRLRLIL